MWHQPNGSSDLLPFRPEVRDLGQTFLPDPPHGWNDTHTAWNAGRFHCSLMRPTDPNRYHMWTGWVSNDGRAGGPVISNAEAGYGWSTYPQRLERAGISWKVHQDSGVGLDAAGFWAGPTIPTSATTATTLVPPTAPPTRAQGLSTVATTSETFPGDTDHPTGPYGLGIRVPMIIVSPWTRGGWVNSQLFDHTSLIRSHRGGVRLSAI